MVRASSDSETNEFDDTGRNNSCLECGIKFTSVDYLFEHLHRHHIKQPRVVLIRHAFTPLKLTIKGTKNEGFRIISAKSPALPADGADGQEEEEGGQLLWPSPPPPTSPLPSPAGTDGPCDDAAAAAASTAAASMQDTVDAAAVAARPAPEETAEIDDDVFDVSRILAERAPPGGEPTPPPDIPDLPKIRIKANLQQPPMGGAVDEMRTMAMLQNAGLTSLFTNNDRAKDLGFTTSDPDFTGQDLAIQPFSAASSALLTGSPLASISSMQQLAHQVSRLQPANGMQQQNVLINIQQFQPPSVPQPPPVQQPPVPHSYAAQMYQQAAPPMYQHSVPTPTIQYQYPSGGQLYYQAAPPTGYAPPPQMQTHGPPMMAPPQVVMARHAGGQRGPPPGYTRGAPPMPQLRMRHQQPRMACAPQMRVRGAAPPYRPPPTSMPILQQTLTAPGLSVRAQMRPPIKRKPPPPIQPNLQQAVPNGKVPPPPAAVVKKMRMDTLVPDRNDDADCEVVAVTHKSSSLPQIHSIQGNVSDPSAMPPPPPSGSTAHREARAEAKDVANVLASRGITVTAGPRQKDTPSPPVSPASNNAVSINLNSAVCIIPQKKRDGAAASPATTVDLTEDMVASMAPPLRQTQPPPPPPSSSASADRRINGSPFECHMCPAKFHTSALLVKHRTVYHHTNVGPEFGIPLIDLKAPGVTQRLTNFGIFHYIPLPNSNSSGMFALPIISANGPRMGGHSPELASSILTLGPIKPINPPRPIVKRGKPPANA